MSARAFVSILESPVTKFSYLTVECCLISNCAALALQRTWRGMASNSIFIAAGVFIAWVAWCVYMLMSKKEIKPIVPRAGRLIDNCNTLLFFYYIACTLFRSINNMPMVWVSWGVLAICLIFFIVSHSRSFKE